MLTLQILPEKHDVLHLVKGDIFVILSKPISYRCLIVAVKEEYYHIHIVDEKGEVVNKNKGVSFKTILEHTTIYLGSIV